MSSWDAPANYWWVNQTETYKLERDLRLLWAPQVGNKNRTQSHWKSMTRVVEGDVVFHYSRQAIQAVSAVTVAAREAQRPYELTLWPALGWQVQLDFQELSLPLPLQDIPLGLRRSQHHKNSPFRSDDKVNVGYLFDLTPDAGVELLKLTGALLDDAEVTDEPETPNGIQRPFVFMKETDGTVIRRFRKEQRGLRDGLLGSAEVAVCDLCGRTFPTPYLITAHIKPRYRCTESERRDSNVVFAACVFGCDALFENGLIVVDADGYIREGRRPAVQSQHLDEALGQVVGRSVRRFSDANSRYFAWHQRHNRRASSKRVH